SRQMRIYLVRIPHRQGHSIQRVVLLASALAGPGRRIQVTSRVGPNGRDLKLPQGSSDRTTGPQHGPFNLLSVLSDAPAPSWRLQYLWPGRRIGLCWQASRLLISPVSTRRRISAHCSMSVYTPASCRTASDHGCDHHRTAGAASERYTSAPAARLRHAPPLWGAGFTTEAGQRSGGRPPAA